MGKVHQIFQNIVHISFCYSGIWMDKSNQSVGNYEFNFPISHQSWILEIEMNLFQQHWSDKFTNTWWWLRWIQFITLKSVRHLVNKISMIFCKVYLVPNRDVVPHNTDDYDDLTKLIHFPSYYGSAEGPLRGVENRNLLSHPDDLRMEAYVIRMT